MKLEIAKIPSEVLRQKTILVEEIDAGIFGLLHDMYETMVEEDGIGIAAPQVSSSWRVALVQLDEEDELFEMINPKIVKSSGADVFVEGCLSIPHVFGTVSRATRIVVEYANRSGKLIRLEAYDYLARAIQHEIDHLDGILFTDKMIEEIAEEELENYYAKYEESVEEE